MIDETLFDELKNYLTKEFMTLSGKKDEMLCEKVSLEVEQQQEDNPLFENKDALRIKRLFSPLDDDIFEEELNSLQNDKISQKIQNIENDLQNVEHSMEDIKKYLCFVQMLENDSKKQAEKEADELETETDKKTDESEIETDKKTDESEIEIDKETDESEIEPEADSESESSSDVGKQLENAVSFLQSRYENTEILMDFENHSHLTGNSFNDCFIRVLTYTISASIEAMEVDTVILEGNLSDDKFILSMQMLLEDQLVDQCNYQFEMTLKNDNSYHNRGF